MILEKNIKISVIMAVFNAEKYLNESIESILAQSFTEFEFIIINDGSNDRSLEIIKSYSDPRIVLLNQNNSGLAKALNNGIKKSKCDFIARMDADDISLLDRFNKQYYFLKHNPEFVIVGSNAIIIDLEGRQIYNSSLPINDYECKKKLPETPFIHPSVMFRKDSFYTAGQYAEQMLTGQDYVLINRMSKLGKFYNIEEPLLKYRIVPNSNSIRSNNNHNKMHVIMSKAINTNNISDDDFYFLKHLIANKDSKNSLNNYYLLLAKKYLWNNYQPKIARMNLTKSFQLNPSFNSLILFIVSFLPSKLISQSYSFIKKLLKFR